VRRGWEPVGPVCAQWERGSEGVCPHDSCWAIMGGDSLGLEWMLSLKQAEGPGRPPGRGDSRQKIQAAALLAFALMFLALILWAAAAGFHLL
jgi:hypothetical protein